MKEQLAYPITEPRRAAPIRNSGTHQVNSREKNGRAGIKDDKQQFSQRIKIGKGVQLEKREEGRSLSGKEVIVDKPELIKEGYLTSYKLYKIKTRKMGFEGFDAIVSRRFNDFEFLHHQIIENYGGYVVPKLPHKNFLANLNLESGQFVQQRTEELQKYLQKLINHIHIGHSQELLSFMLNQSYDFSYAKGEYSEHSPALDNLKFIGNSVVEVTKGIYSKIVGKRERNCDFSRNRQQETEIKQFEHEIQDLLKVTKQISSIISDASQEFTVIHELSILSNNSHLPSLSMQQHFVHQYRILLSEFDDISSFIGDCQGAIERLRLLRGQIQELQQQQTQIEQREQSNPRSKDLDIIRSKLQRLNSKSQRWISALKSELNRYASEGKTLMEDFVRRFTDLRQKIYSSA